MEQEKAAWLKWFETYGAEKFLEAFLSNVEGAESTCKFCGQKIKVDVLIGGGVPDWSANDDFGCDGKGSDGSHIPLGVKTNPL